MTKRGFKGRLREYWGLFRSSFSSFSDDNAMDYSAALAYYTVFSLPSVILIIIYVAGVFYGQAAVAGTIQAKMASVIGANVASTIQTAIRNATVSGGGILTTGLAAAGLIFSATTTFAQLQHSLNAIWGVKPDDSGVTSFAKKRFLSFLVIAGIAVLVLISLFAATIIGGLANSAGLPLPGWALYAIEVIISFAVFSASFAIIFKVLPDVEIAWKDVWAGAIMTSILFVIGKFLISFYLGHSSMGSVYGGAGALALLLLWTYYSSCILFFGAEFVEVWGKEHGRSIQPIKGAICLDTAQPRQPARRPDTPSRRTA